MSGMQMVKSSVIPKTSVKLSSVVRQASCSQGWLRIMVQYIFGAITVASFILIVLMSMQSPPRDDNMPSSCYEHNCRIICNDTIMPFYEDVIYTVSEADVFCSRISLVFINPIFVKETLPAQWLSALRSTIFKLTIIRGNLRFIESQAFMSLFAGNIETIVFEGVTITNLIADSLVGLVNLRQLYFKNCTLIDIQNNALRAVDDTLDVLTISESGNWNPINITGASVLTSLDTVDFSFNIFDNILTNESFTGLQYCKVLYLNSCNITALGPGTFDYLHKIEVIYLNNNFLVTIPTGLFDEMIYRINPRPRINLQDNPWYCDCETKDLRYLHYYGLLYVDPTCDAPEELHGELFSAISNHCINDSHADVIVVDILEINTSSRNDVVTSSANNCEFTNSNLSIISPSAIYSCGQNMTLAFLQGLLSRSSNTVYDDITKSDWITPRYLMRSSNYTIVQMVSLTTDDHGIVWFRTTCLNEVYCISTMPRFLRLYDVDFYDHYTFCPIDLAHGTVKVDKCVVFSTETFQTTPLVKGFGSVVLYIGTAFVCLAFGAAFVYGIIRYNPVLLKGSKRLLFVKHKDVEALVLPPKLPLRSALSTLNTDPSFDVPKNRVAADNENSLSPRTFVRMRSTRSDQSTVSYISALQPTEDQLAEWRVRWHFDNNITMASDAEMSIISWRNDGSNSPEYISSITYESLK